MNTSFYTVRLEKLWDIAKTICVDWDRKSFLFSWYWNNNCRKLSFHLGWLVFYFDLWPH